MKITWYPPNNDLPTVFGDAESGSEYILTDWPEGVESTGTEPDTVAAPGQHGSTLRRINVQERVISFPVFLGGDEYSHGEYMAARQRLARSMIAPLRTAGRRAVSGLLVFDRDPSLPVVRIPASPRNSPRYGEQQARWAVADLEFVCPQRWFESIDAEQFTLGSTGGFTFPMQFPIEMPTYNLTHEIVNSGDAWTPFLAQIWGPVEAPKLVNMTTGDRLEFTGAIPDGSFLEVETGFGKTRAQLVGPDGTRTKVMSWLDVTTSTFWEFQPDENLIAFEANANNGGYVMMQWRRRYGGI